MGTPMRYQPQALARLDRTNPLTLGAQAAISATNSTNLASKIPLKNTGNPLRAGWPVGKAVQFRRSTWIETELQQAIGTASFVEFWLGYPNAVTGNVGANAADPTFLTGSSINNTAIVSCIGGSRNDASWGALYNWQNGSSTQFNSSQELLTPGVLALLIVVRRQSSVEFWHDGRLVRSITQAPLNLAASTFIAGSFIADNYWTSNSDMVLAGRVVAEWTPDQIRSFSANPWQLFEAGSSSSAYQAAIASIGTAGPATYTASIADALTASDFTSATYLTAAQVSDVLSAAETLSTNASVAATVADTLAIAEARTTIATVNAALADTLALADLTSAGTGSITESVTDALAFSEFAGTTVQLTSSVQDTLAVTDSHSSKITALAAIIDSLGVTDQNFVTGATYAAAGSDTLTVADVQSGQLAASAASADGLTPSELLASTLIGHADVAVPALQIPKSRWVMFEGGTRVVVFDGGTRVVVFESQGGVAAHTVKFDGGVHTVKFDGGTHTVAFESGGGLAARTVRFDGGNHTVKFDGGTRVVTF